LKERKKNSELRVLFGLEPDNVVIKNDRLNSLGTLSVKMALIGS